MYNLKAKPLVVLAIVGLALLGVVIIGLMTFTTIFNRSPSTAQSFQSSSGVFYECTQPIAVRPVSSNHLTGTSFTALDAIDEAERDRYCKSTGIE